MYCGRAELRSHALIHSQLSTAGATALRTMQMAALTGREQLEVAAGALSRQRRCRCEDPILNAYMIRISMLLVRTSQHLSMSSIMFDFQRSLISASWSSALCMMTSLDVNADCLAEDRAKEVSEASEF